MTAYNRVARSLREAILAGQWQPGQQLPTERELCENFGASRITIRRALEILQHEQMLERRQGAGTFVAALSSRKVPLFYTDFTGSIARHAPDLTRRLLAFAWDRASREDAAVLDLLPGDAVLHAVRQDLLRGEPVAVDRVCLPRVFSDRLIEADFKHLSFVPRWRQRQKIQIHHTHQTIEAIAATPPLTTELAVTRGAPVLRESSVFKQADGRALGLIVSHYRHDCFRFEATILREPRVGEGKILPFEKDRGA